ncbi:MAG TPA: S41 family peptidase [Bacillota bacterium]|nr:S41 family peptidase [Bacillota bacterium]
MSNILKTKTFKVLVSILALMIILVGIALFINPYQGTVSWDTMKNSMPYTEILSKEQALSELKYLIDLIKDRHYSAITKLPAPVRTQYEQEIKNISEKPDVLDLWRAGSRILKQLEDAHSLMYYLSNDQKRLDIDWKLSGDVLTCQSGTHAGQTVTQMNGILIKELYQRFLAQFSYENIYDAEARFPSYLKRSSTLNWLGVECTDQVQITFNNNGVNEAELYYFQEIATTNQPKFVRYELNQAKSAGIFTLDSCQLNKQYQDTLRQFFIAVKRNHIRYIAIDLRKNGGGNSGVADEFLRYLPVDSYLNFGSKIRLKYWPMINKVSPSKNQKYHDLLFDGKVYVITSKYTFSSATWFAVLLKDNGLAEVIGEPSGNKPSAYGDVLTFQMPYSKLSFSLTYKKFSRPNVAKDQESALFPDYPVDETEAIKAFYQIIEKK